MAYTKTTWASGDIISAAKLNNIEDGVEKANSIHGIIADEYDATATYSVGDYCIYDGNLYKATVDISTAEEWTAAHWTQTTVEAAIADGDKFFLITITGLPVFPPITADKTWSEIQTAGYAGKVLLVKYGVYYYVASGFAPIPGSGGVVTITCPPLGSMDGIQNDAIMFHTFTWGSTGYSVTVSESIYDIAGMAHSLAAEHNTTTSYNVGDYVTKDGVLYKCTTATSGAFTSMFWTAVTVTDENSDFFVVETTTNWWTDTPSTTANCTWSDITAATKPILWQNQIVSVFPGMSGGSIAYIIPYTQMGIGIVPSAYTVKELVFEATGNTVTENDYTTETGMTQVNANIAPLYSEDLTYNVGDLVIFNNSLYQCTTAVSAHESFDYTKWNPTTIAAVIAAL